MQELARRWYPSITRPKEGGGESTHRYARSLSLWARPGRRLTLFVLPVPWTIFEVQYEVCCMVVGHSVRGYDAFSRTLLFASQNLNGTAVTSLSRPHLYPRGRYHVLSLQYIVSPQPALLGAAGWCAFAWT